MQFTAAFNRQDAAGLAALFAEDGFRVTPQGIIQGRDAIQKDADKRFQSRFRDLAITPVIVRASENSIWEAGEWTMKIGDQPVRGYFAMTLVGEANTFKAGAGASSGAVTSSRWPDGSQPARSVSWPVKLPC